MTRPKLTKNIDPEVFDSYYWYKDELIDFAKLLGVPYDGGKFEIHDRIGEFLRTGKVIRSKTLTPASDFDWANEQLTLDTIITDSYKNNQNVREFFISQIGKSFKFNMDFMKYMKANVGGTLQDAVEFYKDLMEARRRGQKQAIPDHNQFNLYTREFLQAHPEMTREQVNICWQHKISIPRPGSKGRGVRFAESDLEFLSK